jgi:Tfp pilus assembly protein PilE
MDCASTITPNSTGRISDCHDPSVPLRASGLAACRHQSIRGTTLLEVMVVTALMTILMAVAAASVCTGNLISRRLSDYTAAMAVVEAKMEDIRAVTYNPPTAPFGSTAVTTTSTSSIDLSQSGTTFIVTGTVTSKIEPVANGHLVTVTGTFQTRRKPLTITLQSVVNKYSAGQQ